jgi:predicted nucleic acid-binding protein
VSVQAFGSMACTSGRIEASASSAAWSQARCWIAATAIARRMPVAAQDADYADAPGLSVIRL